MRRLFLTVSMALLVTQGAAGEWSAERSRELAGEKLAAPFEALKSIHQLKRAPESGDWLAAHKEKGRSFAQYARSRPVRAGTRLTTIYIQPLGEFDETQMKVVKLAADYMGRFFCVPVKVRRPWKLSMVPAKARRVHPSWGMPQVRTGYVLNDLLKPRRPKDALAYIAFTASDWWPGEGWNFVYGQASLRQRVGVWSIYRNGDPKESEETFRLCLRRTIKTAVHETGHILSMYHCIAYECVMNGSNHRAESDRQPLALGPVCLRKLCWNVGAKPLPRYRALAAFCREQKLKGPLAFFEKSIQVLEQTSTTQNERQD